MYKAFLSYNRSDAAFARALQRKLETYVVPKAVELTELQGRAKRPLHPIFRDEDEMVGGGRLSQRLRDALAQSEYLIVVCSPAAASRGDWVDLEVREFLALHGPDRILAVVASGEPNAVRNGHDAALECMPPSLLKLFDDPDGQPLWVDMRAERPDRSAFLRVVGALLAIDSLDQLIRRDAQRQARTRRFILAGSLILLMIIGALAASYLYQRHQAQREAGTVALSRARNALLAGRAQEGYQILRDAYRQGAGSDVENALIAMASWAPTADDLRAAQDNPILIRRGDEHAIVHASGAQTTILRAPERIIYTHNFDRAIVYADGKLATYDLAQGRKLAEREIDGELRQYAKVIAAPSGAFVLGIVNGAMAIRDMRSSLVLVGPDGAISEPMETHLLELDGVRDEVNTMHVGEIPILQADCRYFGFLKPSFATTRWRSGNAGINATLDDFAFFEATADGFRRVQGVPAANSFYAPTMIGSDPARITILPAPPEGQTAGANLDALSDSCEGRPARDLNGLAVAQSTVVIGANADREPRGWWTTDPAPAPGEMQPYEATAEGPCARRRCDVVSGQEETMDGTPIVVDDWSYVTWSRGGWPRGAQTRDNGIYIGSWSAGSMGMQGVTCRIIDDNLARCIMDAPEAIGGSSNMFARDGKLTFAAGGDEQGVGFSLVWLAEPRSIETYRQGGPEYSAELADFSDDSLQLYTLNSSGSLSIWDIGAQSISARAEATTGFVAPFEGSAPDGSIPEEAGRPHPVGLRYVGGDNVLIVRLDGGIALISARTGIEVWQSRLSGLGPLQRVTLSPNRKIAMIEGRSGARLIDTATGIPLSGVFGYPEYMIAWTGNPDQWVADDGSARTANVSRAAREPPGSVAEALAKLETYFGG